MSTRKQTDYLTLIKNNLNKLELNKPYMFTKLCDTLDIPRTTSKKSIIAILKALDSVVVRIEENKKHIITEIRNQAKELVRKGRGNSNLSVNMQTALIGLILANKDNEDICSYDEKHKTYTMYIPTNDIINELHMFNYENYKNARYNTSKYANSIGVSRDIVSENIQNIYQNNHKKFKAELNKLAKRSLIYYKENMLIRKRHVDIDTYKGEYMLDENDNATVLIDVDNEFRVATPQEEMDIISVKRNFLTNNGYKHEGELMNSPNRDTHYKSLNSIIKRKLHIVAHRKVHTIMFKEEDMTRYLDRFATGQDVEFYRYYLGDDFVDNSLKNALNRHKIAIKKAEKDGSLIDSNSDNFDDVINLRITKDYANGSIILHNSIKPSAKVVPLKAEEDNKLLDEIDKMLG